MPPLPEAERRRFIEGALQRGVPHDRIKRDLAQLEGREPLSVSIDPTQALTEARLPGGGPPVTPEEQAAGREFFTQTLPRAAAVTAGGLAAGPGIIPGAIGAAGGDILFQAGRKLLGGKPISDIEAAGAGAGALIGGVGGKILVRSAGAVGGIAKEFLDYAGRTLRPFKRGEGFRLTFGRPPQEAELELGRRIQSTVEAAAKEISAGRVAKEALIKDATNPPIPTGAVRLYRGEIGGPHAPSVATSDAGRWFTTNKEAARFHGPIKYVDVPAAVASAFRETEGTLYKTTGVFLPPNLANQAKPLPMISVQPVVDRLRKHIIPDADEASARNFNKRLIKFADRLEKRGSVTPAQFDALMTKQLSPAAFTGTGKPSLNRFAGAIRDARHAAKETLETAIPEVRAANQAAFEELTLREQADSVFGPAKLSLEMKLRNLFKPGHEAEQQLLDHIGKETGIPLLEEAKRLSTKRAFTRDDRVTAGVLNRVFLLTGTPQIARGVAKIGAPLQRFIGPVSGGLVGAVEEELGP